MSAPHPHSLPGPRGPLHCEPKQPSLGAIQVLLSQQEAEAAACCGLTVCQGSTAGPCAPRRVSGAARAARARRPGLRSAAGTRGQLDTGRRSGPAPPVTPGSCAGGPSPVWMEPPSPTRPDRCAPPPSRAGARGSRSSVSQRGPSWA